LRQAIIARAQKDVDAFSLEAMAEGTEAVYRQCLS
jgi:hypothetical protein